MLSAGIAVVADPAFWSFIPYNYDNNTTSDRMGNVLPPDFFNSKEKLSEKDTIKMAVFNLTGRSGKTITIHQ